MALRIREHMNPNPLRTGLRFHATRRGEQPGPAYPDRTRDGRVPRLVSCAYFTPTFDDRLRLSIAREPGRIRRHPPHDGRDPAV